MSNDQTEQHFQMIRQWLMTLQPKNIAGWDEIEAVLEDLQVSYEQMQTCLEIAEITQEDLSQQNQRIATAYNHYRDLFQSAPIAYLVSDAKGVILEANGAIAHLLNVPQPYLAGKPLMLYVAEGDRSAFRNHLSQLPYESDRQIWHMTVCPRGRQPFASEWHIATLDASTKPDVPHSDRQIEIRIAVYDLSRSQPENAPLEPGALMQPATLTPQPSPPALPLPQSLDGLRVLVVEDEADIREFVTAVFEAHGIGVKTVSSVAAALEALEQFRPDVLLSDIRMPERDGYSLIRQIRALEGQMGRHIPAAAMTAYLEEDREKVIKAGFEAHLHKLAQPSEWVELVAQLAREASSLGHDALD
ncbi:response regulator [Leptolyngbya sp. FACHB-16]|nr:response regulator [Leptolyngbya sp. FACHB-8]MBD2153380.1 response regulator [Leptolyngbya sp. FACHB-16]